MAKSEVSNRDLRTTAQACAQISCSRSTIDRLVKAGKLERVPFGNQTRITARSLNALVDEALTGSNIFAKEGEDDARDTDND